jgi:LmbE family N-acetylglucosaminyl deacetylase
MNTPLKLLCVFAHPDDETLGCGPLLAHYAAEGVETYLITATRGERGWQGPPEENPGLEALGEIRESELDRAATVLGLQEIVFLDYVDGDLDEADPVEASEKIAGHIRRLRPDVVITFAPDGYYGHPDHIAISQFTAAALIRAAGSDRLGGNGQAGGKQFAPHQVRKFYYLVDNQITMSLIEPLVGEFDHTIDGARRGLVVWPDWEITTWLDCSDYWQATLEAVQCHASQVAGWVEKIVALPPKQQRQLWGNQTLYRVYSLVNGGRQVEDDIFAGLRR